MWEKRQSEISQGVAWEKREQGIYLTGYSGEDEELILPDEIEGEPVTGSAHMRLQEQRLLWCGFRCICGRWSAMRSIDAKSWGN